MRFVLFGAGLLAWTGGLSAQDSLVFCMDGNEVTLDNGSGLVEAGLIREDETAIVTPTAGTYSASVFHSMVGQWGFIGDHDQDGLLLDASGSAPGEDTDAVFVKRFPSAPAGSLGPRDVYLSKEAVTGFLAGFEDGDVFGFQTQGSIDVFVTETQLLGALGQSPTADLDLDAICQSSVGDLFVSFSFDEAAPGGTVADGGFVRIPAAAITYDASDNVAAITVGSAQIIAQEGDVNGWIAASGVKTSVGGDPTTSIDLSALEIDPAGGTFEAPQVPGLFLPNLLFAWSGFSNDGAVLSTAGGGTIASLNGVALGSTVATTGTQVGLTPDSTGLGGLMGMAVIPARPAPLTVENHPTSLITSSTILWSRQETSGAMPGSLVAFFVDIGPTGAGAFAASLTIPGFAGELFGDGTVFVTGLVPADGKGYAGNVVSLPLSFVGATQNLIFQVFDTSAFAFGAPAPVQFL